MSLRKTSTMVFRITMKMVIVAVLVAVFYVVCSKAFEYGAAIFSGCRDYSTGYIGCGAW